MSEKLSLTSFFGALQAKFLIHRRGEKVGEDEYGNVYYQEKKARKGTHKRRWVIYDGEPDPTKVPAEWFGWLHYSMDAPIAKDSEFQQDWVKPKKRNMTGTQDAYFPSGDPRGKGQRDKATGDYQPWVPE